MVTNIMGKSFRGNTLITEGLALKFFGIGRTTAQKVCSRLGFYPGMRMHQLDEPKILLLQKELANYTIETDLKNQILKNINIKHTIGSYQGSRHAAGLPVHGQRTRTNAKTAKHLNRLGRRL